MSLVACLPHSDFWRSTCSIVSPPPQKKSRLSYDRFANPRQREMILSASRFLGPSARIVGRRRSSTSDPSRSNPGWPPAQLYIGRCDRSRMDGHRSRQSCIQFEHKKVLGWDRTIEHSQVGLVLLGFQKSDRCHDPYLDCRAREDRTGENRIAILLLS